MKKIVTYIVTLGMMLSMMPASVSAADTPNETTAVTAEEVVKVADKNESAIEAMNNMNIIFSLTDGAMSGFDTYSKVTDERFKTIDSVKKLISDTCTGDLKDEFLKKCDKCLVEKEDGLYKKDSALLCMFLTGNGVEVVAPAMDGFIAITKQKDQMNDYGKAVLRSDGSTWKISSYEFGFFTVNNSESDLQSATDIRVNNLKSILSALSYSAPEDSTDTITVNDIKYGRVKEEWQNNVLDWLKELISENCTGEQRDIFLYQAEHHFVEQNGVLYAPVGGRGFLDINTNGGFIISDISDNGFTAVTKSNSQKDGYAKMIFAAEDDKWRIKEFKTMSSIEEAVALKDLAGRWIMEVSDGNYAVNICSKYDGAVIINEDGTCTYTSVSGDTTTGRVSSNYEEFPEGNPRPIIYFFENETLTESSGFYNKEDNSIYFGTDGMTRMVRDDSYDKELSSIAIERISNYGTIEMIESGSLKCESDEAFKVNDIPYYKVIDKTFNSIAAIKAFINENTAGEMNRSMLKVCDNRYIEKDGVLYTSFAGKGSVGTDTSKGVMITNKTDNSFNATTIAPNGIPGSGHTRASFIAEDNTWKISSMEYDTYAYNRSSSDFEHCASSRVSSLNYFMEYFERGASEIETEKIKINGVEYVKDSYQVFSIDELKNEVKKFCTGTVRENLLSRIDDRFIEKDGTLYRKAAAGLALPDFALDKSLKITSIPSEDKFKAATVDESKKDGYAIFEFVKEGDRFLISSYSFSIFNDERLFGGYVNTESGDLNLREQPNTSSKILAEIPKGTQLDIYASGESGWYKVAYNGKIGYVSSEFIEMIQEPVSEKKSGDVNGDGSVNLKDVVMIRRYIAGGWNVAIDEKLADVNKDGSVNLKDVVMIRRYIAGGWNVEL